MNMRSSLKIEGKRAFFSRVGLDLLTDLRESETDQGEERSGKGMKRGLGKKKLKGKAESQMRRRHEIGIWR